MKLLFIILCILFIFCLYSNNILYGAEACAVSLNIHNQNKTNISIINNKIKEIQNKYKEIQIEAHKELKIFHESTSDYSNKLIECKNRLNNKLLEFDSININNLLGGNTNQCKKKIFLNNFVIYLKKKLKIYLKHKFKTFKSKSTIYINNWYNDIKNNLLNGSNKVNDYDTKIQQLDEKYGKFNITKTTISNISFNTIPSTSTIYNILDDSPDKNKFIRLLKKR